jgi:cytidyltransferase-like protein
MNADVRSLIEALHSTPSYRYAIVASGGGSTAAAWLLSVPGGSRTILDIAIPYSEAALCDYLGRRPDSFCSAETSRLLAARALERARRLAPRAAVLGVGCTASLRSDRPKRGDHRLHIAFDFGRGVDTLSVTLAKEQRSREEEEEILDRSLLNGLAVMVGVPHSLNVSWLPGENPLVEQQLRQDALSAFFARRLDAVRIERDGRVRADAPHPTLLLPGSFNPVHEGHWRLAEAAARHTEREAVFELTVHNAEKPPLDDEEVRWRATQFLWRAPLWLTRVPTFIEKARLFPGTTFLIGADTAARIVEPRFYDNSEAKMNAALAEFASLGARFLVAGRVDSATRFLGLDDLAISPQYRPLFEFLSNFRVDVSSTQLRARMQ